MATPSEDLLRSIASLLDGLDVALCVFDDQDRSLLWNRAFLQLFPEHQSHVSVGEPYRDNLRRFYEGRLGPDELPQIEDYIQAGIVRHRTQHQPFEFEHRGRFIKASSLPLPGVGRMRLWSQRVSRSEDSQNNGRRRSDTLTGATDAGRALLDRVPDGLMICGRDGRIQWVNEPLVRMYGLPTRADARGATLASLYRSAWRDCGPEQAQQMADGLKTLEDNLRFSGAPFELPLPGNRFTRIITQPIHADEAFYAHVDITEIKRQQHQLARLNQDLTNSTQQARDASLSKSQFLANMSHEIRTPMHAILGLLELLQTTTLDHEQRDYVDKTRGAGRSLLTLLDDILDLSKVEAGRMTLDPQPFELEQLLRDLSVILSASVGDKPLELLFDIEPGLPEVLIGDQKRLHQILLNLAFKPNTDDMRAAPSRAVMERLWAMGASVQAYDPVAMEEARRLYGDRADLQLVNSPMDALKGADALLIVTEWKPFKSPDFALMKQLLRQPVVFDGRNLYEPARVRAAGLEYFSVGRG